MHVHTHTRARTHTHTHTTHTHTSQDMDGWLPVDYVLANPNARSDSTVRAFQMLLHVNADGIGVEHVYAYV